MATVADDALAAQSVNRMLGAGADVAQTFQQTILRHNNEFSALSSNAARQFELMSNLLMTNSALELSGNALQLQAGILGANSVKGEPRPAPYGNCGASGAAPPVFMINPTTGAVTKA
jgi:hypothetical protein